MIIYGLLPIAPVNGRGLWLKGYDEFTAWLSQDREVQLSEISELPPIEYSVKNHKLLQDCIAVGGQGLLVSDKVIKLIKTLNCKNLFARPLNIQSTLGTHNYFWLNIGGVIEDALVLEKTPFFIYETGMFKFSNDLIQSLQEGIPTPEGGVWLDKSKVSNHDLFMFYVNSPYRFFASDRFVKSINENNLTGFRFERADWIRLVER